jgi:putative ABC transport system permease protein
MVISESFARVLARDGATVGRRLRLSRTGDVEWEVVGVVRDVQVAALDAVTPPVIYVSHLQLAENRMTLVLRTDLAIAAIANEVRAIVKDMDPGIPVYAVSTIDRKLNESSAVFTRRLPMLLVGVFAAAALALTLIALYATCVHEVQSRSREFGIRLALGSTPGSIRQLIFGAAAVLAASGIGIGAFGAALVSRSMQALLFGITATDWRVYGAVAVGVMACACLATLVPALRAGSVNPGVIMRSE